MMELENVKSMSRDLAKAAKDLSDDEARFLVDYYYLCQEDRKLANNQVLALTKSGEPSQFVQYLADQAATLEGQVKRALDKYTEQHLVGEWVRSLYGFGPVITAGLLAHIDITKAPTAGHIWSYAGLVPGVKWEKGQKRPWNAKLKVLLWKAGQCMMKFSNKEECYYGRIYKEAKAYYVANNEALKYADQARHDLETQKYRKAALRNHFVNEEEAVATAEDPFSVEVNNIDDDVPLIGVAKKEKKEFLSPEFYLRQGKLPPGQIDARARRYAVKLFISHLQEVWYTKHYGERPPKPYAIAFLGHAHQIAPPNFQ